MAIQRSDPYRWHGGQAWISGFVFLLACWRGCVSCVRSIAGAIEGIHNICHDDSPEILFDVSMAASLHSDSERSIGVSPIWVWDYTDTWQKRFAAMRKMAANGAVEMTEGEELEYCAAAAAQLAEQERNGALSRSGSA